MSANNKLDGVHAVLIGHLQSLDWTIVDWTSGLDWWTDIFCTKYHFCAVQKSVCARKRLFSGQYNALCNPKCKWDFDQAINFSQCHTNTRAHTIACLVHLAQYIQHWQCS